MRRLVKKAYVSILILAFCLFVIINVYQARLKTKLLSDNELAVIQFNAYFKNRKRTIDLKLSSLASVSVYEKESVNFNSPSKTDRVPVRKVDDVTSYPMTFFETEKILSLTPLRIKNVIIRSLQRRISKTRNKIRLESRKVIPEARGHSKSVRSMAKLQHVHKKDSYSIEKPTKTVTASYGLGFSKAERKMSLKGNGAVKLQKYPKTTNRNDVKTSRKLWFLSNGNVRPKPCAMNLKTGERVARLYPEEDPEQDRIPNQLMFVPPKKTMRNKKELIKSIFLFNSKAWGVPFGRREFMIQQCPVNSCAITDRIDDIETADAVIFRNEYPTTTHKRALSQIWILQLLESPEFTSDLSDIGVPINWTATYRSDSTIVSPYQRWYYYDKRVTHINQNINYALSKTKKVAWFVSHCETNNKRLQYAEELQKHIQVDIYGSCGTKSCSRSSWKCFDMLNKYYKFYLSFENSNCREYITEKFFVNGLQNNIVPIVMGAHPDDYKRVAPYKSYIHVDEFKNPKELAAYLHKLDKNDHLYNEYFQWKGTGEFINTRFFCRVCALLHDTKVRSSEHAWYHDFSKWWWAKDVCIQGSWRDLNKSRQKNILRSHKKMTT